MATLVEGEKYGLSSTSANYELKSVVHVKLTDSALKAIEDLLKCKVWSVYVVYLRRNFI